MMEHGQRWRTVVPAERTRRATHATAAQLQMLRAERRPSVERLWVMVAAPASALTPARWRALLRVELAGLRSTLEEQFELEERGGYLREVIEHRPKRARLVDMLREQHTGITMQLGWLLRRLRDRSCDVHTIKSGIRDVLAFLKAHEHGESDLAQELRDLRGR